MEQSLNICVVEAGEAVAHDPPSCVSVLRFVGVSGERVPEVVWGGFDDGLPISLPLSVHGRQQLSELVADRCCSPWASVFSTEDQAVVRPLGQHAQNSLFGFGPEWGVALDLCLGPAVVANDSRLEFPAGELAAVSGTIPAVDPEEHHGFELAAGLGEKQADEPRGQEAAGFLLADDGGRNASEPLTELHWPVDPVAVVGMGEHRYNAAALPVVGMVAEADFALQIAAVGGEIIGPQISDQSLCANEITEAAKSLKIVIVPAGRDQLSERISPLLSHEAIAKFLDRQGARIAGDRPWQSSCVEVVLYPVVLSQSAGPIAIPAEVVHFAVDAFGKTAILARLCREPLNGQHLVVFASGHEFSGRYNTTANSVQDSVQSTFLATVENSDKCLAGKRFGSIAQRLEQGSHKTLFYAGNRISGAKNAVGTPKNTLTKQHETPQECSVEHSCLWPAYAHPSCLTVAPASGEKPLMVPVVCIVCGKPFLYLSRRVRELGRGCACSPSCVSVLGHAGIREKAPVITPPSLPSDRVRASGLVDMRIRRGYFDRPTICQKCGRNQKTDAHHNDYGKPDEVLFLCRSCHMKAHRDPSFIEGINPIKVAVNRQARAEKTASQVQDAFQ